MFSQHRLASCHHVWNMCCTRRPECQRHMCVMHYHLPLLPTAHPTCLLYLTVDCQADCWSVVTYWQWLIDCQYWQTSCLLGFPAVPGNVFILSYLVNLLSIQDLLFHIENSLLFFADTALMRDTVNLSDLLFCLAAVGETTSAWKLEAGLGTDSMKPRKGAATKTEGLHARCGCTDFAHSQTSCKLACLKIDSLPRRRKLHSNEFALSHTLGQF